jgi:hypothetical protein
MPQGAVASNGGAVRAGAPMAYSQSPPRMLNSSPQNPSPQYLAPQYGPLGQPYAASGYARSPYAAAYPRPYVPNRPVMPANQAADATPGPAESTWQTSQQPRGVSQY